MPDAPIVYVVDDNGSVRDSLAALFRAAGYRTRVYPSADAILRHDDLLAREMSAHRVVVTDLRMPGTDGMGLLRELRSRAEFNAISVILLTGHADVPAAVQAMREGADDFLEKPVEGRALLAAVRDAIARARPLQEDQDAAAARKRMEVLTPRERDVLSALLEHGSNKAVASVLQMSPRTVEAHRAHILEKTGASGLPDLVRLALLAGIGWSPR